MADISISDQIDAVKREIGLRKRLYPRWVLDRKMTQAAADRELANMEAVLATLEGLAPAAAAPAGLFGPMA